MASRQGTAYTEDLSAVATRHKAPMFLSERAVPNEKEVIEAIERWLSIPYISGLSEDELAVQLPDSGEKCTDPDFPPTPQSLFADPDNPPATAPRGADWKRVHGQLYVPSTQMIKLLPGALRNRWFLGAVACVASRQDLALDLIVSDNRSEQGLYTFQFYKHGCWHQVVVDDYVPCVLGEDEVLFACSATPGELWPSLLEKAYAKLHGSYMALDAGSISEALVDLTGGVVTKLKLDTDEGEELADTGALWSRLLLFTSWGYIVAAINKVKPAAEGAVGPGGLLLNHAYSVIDCRVLPDGTRLLRLHNPWPVGGWDGAWSLSAREWENPELQGHLNELMPTFEDKSTFWMSYVDFAKAFNRLYVTRLFPPTWHQLTLHSGWHGRTAGGPTIVGGLPNSTWCCNPQFKLTARKSGELLLCLSQRDPHIVHGCHVSKAQRDFKIGFQVVQMPAGHHGRIWTLEGLKVLYDSGLQGARELSLSVHLDPHQSLMIVPFSSLPGSEGPFVLRTFSSVAIEMSQVPSPLALVIGGAWRGHLAGGRYPLPSWSSNPQFMLSTQQRARVMITLIRTDVRHSVIKEAQPAEAAIGLIAAEPEMSDTGLARRTTVTNETAILAQSDFDAFEEAMILLELLPDKPYVLVPSTVSAGIEAPFELRILSSVAVELVPLPETKTVLLAASWNADSGGCDLNPFWFKRNPKFVIVPDAPITCQITLTRASGSWKRGTHLDKMIGFYILAASDASGTVMAPNKAIRAESTFVPCGQSTLTYELTPTATSPAFVIVPCTYGPGCKGDFSLSITASSSAFSACALDSGPPVLQQAEP